MDLLGASNVYVNTWRFVAKITEAMRSAIQTVPLKV